MLAPAKPSIWSHRMRDSSTTASVWVGGGAESARRGARLPAPAQPRSSPPRPAGRAQARWQPAPGSAALRRRRRRQRGLTPMSARALAAAHVSTSCISHWKQLPAHAEAQHYSTN